MAVGEDWAVVSPPPLPRTAPEGGLVSPGCRACRQGFISPAQRRAEKQRGRLARAAEVVA